MDKNIDLVTRYQQAVDEMFTVESKRDLVTNKDFSWDGAKAIKVYKVTTVGMNDYNRDGDVTPEKWSRYGDIKPIDAVTETLTLGRDRSFTFMLDSMDLDETTKEASAAKALARQLREVVIPEYDKYVYGVMLENAGTVGGTGELNEGNIYDAILEGSAALDEAMVPETERFLIIPPKYYRHLKKSAEIAMATDVGQDMRLKGVVGVIDGIKVIKVPAHRLPENVGFILAHKCATVAPMKLQDFITHENPPGLNGYLVEGRVYYDAFVLDNKKKAIYVWKTAA